MNWGWVQRIDTVAPWWKIKTADAFCVTRQPLLCGYDSVGEERLLR